MAFALNGVHYSNYNFTITYFAGINPVSIDANSTITQTLGAAVFFTGTNAWTISNSGTLEGTGTASTGISLLASAELTNTATGLVGGFDAGISDSAAATLTNSGSIFSTGTAGAAVRLAGGAVANAGGQITGGGTGVSLSGSGVVTNTGTIAGAAGDGVLLAAGGAVGNYGTGGVVTGLAAGVSLAAGGTVINQGTIASLGTTGPGYTYSSGTFTPLTGGVIAAGGGVSNAVGGTITSTFIGVAQTAPGSVVNAGRISGTSSTIGIGVWLTVGGQVTNAAGGTISAGFDGVLSTGTATSTVTNDGMIQAPRGIDMFAASVVNNNAGGTITATSAGVYGRSGGTVSNAGSINGAFGVRIGGVAGIASNAGTIVSTGQSGGAGIQLAAGGSATNFAGGYISAKWIGIQIGAGANNGSAASPGGTVVNSGTVIANDAGAAGAAVWIRGSGLIQNNAGGTIAGGPFGIVSYDQITVVNSGSIGGSEFAVFASNAGKHNLIVAAPGAVFSGKVAADTTASTTGTLELAAGTLTGTIAAFGSKYTGFSDVIIDAGAHWSLGGTISASQTISLPGTGAGLTLANPTQVAGTITGFDASETLTLGGITDVTSATLGAGNVLTVTESGGGTITLQFDPAQNFGGTAFHFAADAGGTALTVPCFAAGTRILTTRGEVPVQALRVGDLVVTREGRHAPVRWLGHRRVDCRRHPRPGSVWPVRIRAGAFGEGLPRRDLVLSPDHAVFVDPVLVKAVGLVNDATIVQERVDQVTYWHVELDRHDVLLAEGLPAESYLDTGNRADFANGGAAVTLHPDFARHAWAKGACARLVVAGPELLDARAALLRRARRLGWTMTPDPAVTLHARGMEIAPAGLPDGVLDFELPRGARVLRLRSRSLVPAHALVSDPDRRRLGLAVAALALDGQAVALTDPRLGVGWHAPADGVRWTDGDAAIAAGGARRLTLRIMPLARYPLHAAAAAAPRPPRRAGA